MASMYFACAIFAALLVLSQGHHHHDHHGEPSTHQHETKKDICRGFPCPSYEVVNHLAEDLEEREYNPIHLPSYTATQCLTHNQARSQGYFHLRMYASAMQNAERKRISTGVPVLTEVKHVDDVEPRCSWIYTTFFYVNETTLPTPVTTDITVKPLEELHFYVYSFGGYNSKPQDNLLAMRIRLNTRKLCYNPSTYYIADYQSPGTQINRRNEIWVPVRPCNKDAGDQEVDPNEVIP